jgi:TolC family type I secretion outer membrane protein
LRRRFFAGFGRAFLALCFLSGGMASAETLGDALTAAYESNPTLKAQRAKLRATDEGLPEARGGWRPTVTATGDAGYAEIDNSSSPGTESLNPLSYGLNVKQPLYSGGRTVAGTSRAKNLVMAERANLLSVEQTVMLAAARAYVDVLRDTAVLALQIKNEQVLRRELDATRDRFSVGEVTRTDVAQAEARQAQAVAGRIGAIGNLNSARATYLRVVGKAPESPESPPPLIGLPETLEVTQQLAEEGNPDMAGARFAELAARDDISLAKGEMLPTLSLNGSVEHREESNFEGSESDRASVIAQLTIPLYQAGGPSARVRRAKQTASQRRVQVEETRRLVRERATLAWEVLDAARARITQFEIQVSANEIALAGTRQEALHGLRILIDVLNAEQELLDAQVDLVGAQRNSYVAGLHLLATIGRLTARDLALPVEYYDEQAYYNRVKGKIWGTGTGSAE